MRYFLDTEFNAFGGDLISLALVREDGAYIYLIYPKLDEYDPWVAENVLPKLRPTGIACTEVDQQQGAVHIAEFLKGDPSPMIVTDWPDDIRYFCAAIITGPGQMAPIPGLAFQMIRIDAYPTKLAGATEMQHNALWDARALRYLLLS
ncbi:Rnase H [Caulobacter phage CcrRogue]|uniref:Uncharacterized protein n=1 Tax=Caulobacter phage CcrRogue TaxID=2927986 RepID=K4JMX3_9CAUD|nr:Rnase H [Caulobacter phage CcrRogue]AFU86549.1 hypothetical protein CcrRogue_gp067 [Caulobacter phage CcrRogue]